LGAEEIHYRPTAYAMINLVEVFSPYWYCFSAARKFVRGPLS
jgi:hypothetical protein